MVQPSGVCNVLNFERVSIDCKAGGIMGISTKSLAGFFQVPDGLLLFLALTFVLYETRILSNILALDLQSGMWRLCFKDKVVVAVWAILVTLVKLLDILAESLFALFACKDHFEGGLEVVCLGLGVAFCAIEPFAACCRWRVSDGIAARRK
jgi:hypothetical protein